MPSRQPLETAPFLGAHFPGLPGPLSLCSISFCPHSLLLSQHLFSVHLTSLNLDRRLCPRFPPPGSVHEAWVFRRVETEMVYSPSDLTWPLDTFVLKILHRGSLFRPLFPPCCPTHRSASLSPALSSLPQILFHFL